MSKETKTILIIIGIILILVILVASGYFIYKKVAEISGAVSGTIADKAETKVLADKTGVDEARVDAMREAATIISNELGTGKNSGWMGTYTNTDETVVINALNKANTPDEMRLMKNIYESSIVPGSNFYSDLNDALQDYEFRQVKFLSEIY